MRRSGFDPDSHSGKALPTCWRPIRATSCSRSTRTRSTTSCSRILHLDERPRVRVLARRDRFDRFVSVLVYVPRDRYDTARARARSARYLASVYKGRVSAFYPFFPEGPLVRVHFIIGRFGGETPNPDRADARAARSRQLVRTWTDGLAEALTLVHEPIKAQQLIAPLSRRVSGRLSRGLSAAGRGRGHPAHREPVADPPARRRFLHAGARAIAACARPEGVEPREADPALRARAGAGEHGLPGRRRAHLPHRAGRRRRGRGVAARHDAGARRRRGVRSRSAEGAARSLLPGGDARRAPRTTATTRWCSTAGAAVARRRARAHDLALSCARSRVAYSQDYMWATLRRHAGIAAQIVAAVPHALRSAARASRSTSAPSSRAR